MNGSQKYLVPSSKPRSSMYELWGFMKWALAEPEAGTQGRRGRARGSRSMYELWGFMKWALAEPEAGAGGCR